MDNPGGSNESGLTDDEKMKVGLQQAALIKMQQSQDEEQQLRERALRQQQMLEQQKEQELMEAQQKALHIRMEQERQQAEEQQKIQLQLQAKALQERQKEEELKRIQEIALMERQREELQDQPPQPPQPPRLMPQQPPIQGGPHLGVPPQFAMGAPQPLPTQNLPPPPQLQGQHQLPSHPGGLPQPPQPQVGGQSMGAAMPPVNRPPALSQPPVTNVPRQAAPPMPPHMTGSSMPPHLSGQAMLNQQSGPMRPPFSSAQQNMQQMMPPRDQQASMMQPPMGQNLQRGPPNQQGNIPREMMRSEPQGGIGNQQGPPQLMGRDAPPVQPFQGNEDRERGRPPPLMSMETRPPLRPSEKEEEMPIQQQQQADQEEPEPEFKLPQALEKVLAFKDVRVQEVGVMPEEMERVEKGEIIEEVDEEEESTSVRIEDYGEEEDEEEEEEEVLSSKASKKKESKNQRRKQKKKRAKQRKQAQANMPPSILKKKQILPPKPEEDEDVEIEYIVENIELDRTDPSYREFNKIFQAFKVSDPEVLKKPEKAAEDKAKEEPVKKLIDEMLDDDDDDSGDEKPDDEDKPKLSKKKLKKLNRLSVAELKQLVSRPDVVEMHDVTARDPKLLVNLKATRNSVPVPRHWCFKRKYLQGKRGIEKAPFDLPDFIKNTGIMEMRQALQDKEEAKNLKAKMREKVRPKMGKIDIDYQKLHDAFFKYQTKPKMTIHGDLYYEAKEFETRLKEKKPGNLTDDLRTALGMPLGLNAEKYPPPWLIAMQRYGPPPSYPNLKIPGLNAPIPEGCSFGYHAGGWGKPPVDESGKPLYGDVFGAQGQEVVEQVEDEDVDKTRWGELESESEEESESESESEGEEAEVMDSGLVTPGDTGLVTPSGVTSVPIGVETPDMIELRKKRIEDAMDQGGDTPALYQVLPEKKAAVGGAMMGSSHVYDISAVAAPSAPKVGGENAEGIEVALNPDELDLDTAAMQAKYEQQVREQQSQLEKEDLSDMVADHAAKQAKKRKKQQQDTTKSAKKYKEFKF